MKSYKNFNYKEEYEKVKNLFVTSRKKRDSGVKYLNIPVAFDTETTSFYESYIDEKGKIVKQKRACVYLWQFGFIDTVYYGRKIEEFPLFLQQIKEKFKLNSKKKMIIYVHNLSFDFQFISEFFTVTDIFARTEYKPIYAELNECFVFKCSYFLTNKSLKLLAEETTTKKLIGDLDYTLYRHYETPLTKQEMQYAENDILILLEYIAKQIEKEKNITKIPLTSTGYVRRFYLDYLQNNYNFNEYKKKYKPIIEIDFDVFTLLEKAFAGGYTHANYINAGLICKNVKSIDFTSSYPFVICSSLFPMKKFQHINIESKKQFLEYISNSPCVFTIIFKDLKAKTSITTISKSKCRLDEISLKSDNGRIISTDFCETTITEIDFQIIDKFYTYSDFVIIDFYKSVYGYLPKPLIECVLKLYADKTQLKGIEEKADLYQLSKALLNSFYGMCVTNPLNSEIFFDDFKGWSSEEELTDEKKKERLEKSVTSYSSVLSYAWGVWVTAYARKNLLEMVKIIGDDVVYCDTDSIKYMNYEKYEKIIDKYNQELLTRGKEVLKSYKIDENALSPEDIKGNIHPLGIFTDEGVYTDFKTVGAKRYMTVKNNNLLQITVSGIKKNYFYKWLNYTFGGNCLDIEKNATNDVEKMEYYKIQNEDEKEKIFDLFEDEKLEIPEEYTGKMTHCYIDEKFTCNLTDYTGKVAEVTQQRYIHLEKQPFKMSLDDEFQFLITLKFEKPERKEE